MQENAVQFQESRPSRSSSLHVWLVDLLLVLILIAGGALRVVGLNWDSNLHAHPDERFLTMVESAITPVKSLGEYFNTAQSSLNPANHGFGFFVYGTAPLFLVRYAAEAVGQTGYDQVFLVGRLMSAIFDLLTVLFVFLIGSRLYDRRVGVLAAAFSAFAVLQIQLAHFFTVDSFTTAFTTAAIYIAVRIMGNVRVVEDGGQTGVIPSFPRLGLFLLFGAALGLGVASKINAAAAAVVLVAAVGIHLSRLNLGERKKQLVSAGIYLAAAALVSLVVFRIFQPYSFNGPGFFGISINQNWVQSLKTLSQQSAGAIDSPPELQWTARPPWFAWINMVQWGMGWPLGLLAWVGFIWMGWLMLKGEARQHLLIWSWTGLYFLWQSLSFTRTMRYELLIYPTLEIIAAWAVIRLWDTGASWVRSGRRFRFMTGRHVRAAAGILGAVAMLGTALWAVAFVRIYIQPHNWLAASEWIYQNVPGPIEFPIQTGQGTFNQQVPFRNGTVITTDAPQVIAFKAEASGLLIQVSMPHVQGVQVPPGGAVLTASAGLASSQTSLRVGGSVRGDFSAKDDARGSAVEITLDQPIAVQAGQQYSLQVGMSTPASSAALYGPITLGTQTSSGMFYQPLPPPKAAVTAANGYSDIVVAQASGTLNSVSFPHILDLTGTPGEKQVRFSIKPLNGGASAAGSIHGDFLAGSSNLERTGKAYQALLDHPIQMIKGASYSISLIMEQGQGEVSFYGSATAIETDWDVPLPYVLPGYPSPWDANTGIYQGDMNTQSYYPDDPASYGTPQENKLNRFLTTLDQADYIFISSNRQWATTTRVPQRYPLTTAYYRELLGCPVDKDIRWCYSVATPGKFHGQLGFDLAAVFQSEPGIGSLQINDQGAEEAFTVYDHPKVLVFKKNTSYSQQSLIAALSKVDLSHVVHLMPDGKIASGSASAQAAGQNADPPKSLTLPEDRLAADTAGGTWSALFNRGALQNRYPGLGMVLWYLAVSLLGWAVYPLVRLALPGLPDRGYPLARLAGLLILALAVWLAGSLNLGYTRVTITAAAFLIVLVGLVLGYLQRADLAREWRDQRKVFVWVEIIALLFFAADLLIRLGNPDLWHPSFGGEKPMDFSFFNAVIKSTSFPPYDPWFAGGYINYYYYGFVIFGVPVKALGIIPAVAYNLILPTIYSLLALGAFSLGWNIVGGLRRRSGEIDPEGENGPAGRQGWIGRLVEPFYDRAFQVGLAAVVGFQVLGNLGTVRMIWYGIQKLVAPDGNVDSASFIQRWIWTFQGLPKWLAGAGLPYYPGDWYWIPSRVVIPTKGNEITEFPMFTILYADPHAHLFALPVTLLVIAWALSVVLACARWGEADGRHRWLSLGLSFFLGAVALGALRPTNTWDYYTYTVFGCAALLYAFLRYYRWDPSRAGTIPDLVYKLGYAFGASAVLVGLSVLLYQPFNTWFAQGYTSIQPWDGNKTPFWSYLTHWGVFLFAIVSWMIWETRDWMASTPASALNKLRPYLEYLEGFAILAAGAVVILLVKGVQIAWLVLPLAIWAGVLMLRPNLPDSKRFVLFLTGTALVLTLVVEVFVVKGDIGRQNTIFKFYLQAWTMLAVSAAAALGWLLPALPAWRPNLRNVWSAAAAALVVGAALFPITAGRAKILDRMSPAAPHSLDGMAFMATSSYTYGPDNQPASTWDLNQDYLAIRWMQDHIQGSPVIVEGHTSEYRWENRFSMFTGLPGVVGYQWHEEQQRSTFGTDPVSPRVAEVDTFYNTPDLPYTQAFLKKYNVRYIIVGQLEEAMYPQTGLAKFAAQDGVLWKQVFHTGATSIYEVQPVGLASSPG